MRCPICKREFNPEQSDAMPFCSSRCRSIDLGRWLGESYGMPVVPDPEDDEKPEGDGSVEGQSPQKNGVG